MGVDDPLRPELRPSLAETFDMKARFDGFDAMVGHLPLWAGRLEQALKRRSRLRLSASRLHVNAESWPLSELELLRASGSTIRIVSRTGRSIVLVSAHSPWACAELCRLINAQLRWHRAGQQHPPPALQVLRERGGAQRKASV
ncbi:MAG: hypothetical protein ACI8S6_005008 [Myxococcota bacterium]|jgi:hypothetical protein